MKSIIILALLLTAVLAQNPCDCPTFKTTPVPGSSEYTFALDYSLKKENIQPPPPQSCNPVDRYHQWNHQCIYTLSCSTISDSIDRFLFFKKFEVNSKSGGSVHIEKFTITNPGMLSSPLISFDEEFIPEQQGGSKKFSYAPNVIVGVSKTQYADLYFQLSSTNVMADNQVDEVDVSIEFTCSVYDPKKKRDDEKGKTVCIIVGFILPLIITVIYIILAIIRANNPELLSRVRAWAGFKELTEDESSMQANLKPAEEKAWAEQPDVQEKANEEKSESEKSSENDEVEDGEEKEEGEEI